MYDRFFFKTTLDFFLICLNKASRGKTNMTDWMVKLSELINPITEKKLADEKRLKSVEVVDNMISVKYDRLDFSLEQKKSFEEFLYQSLKSDFTDDRIRLMSFSDSAQPTSERPAPGSHANLKVGHGTVGQKKRIAGVKKVIAISSCKGGVGKSTVAVNLGLTLIKQGLKVGILDADIYGPSIPMLLGKREAQPMANEAKKIQPIESFGIKFISFGLFIKESDPVIWRGPMLGGVLNQFLFDVDWGELDILLIDLPPGTGDMQLSMIQTTEVDGAVIVSTPQSVALLDAKKGLAMFQQVNVPIMGMVENMSYFVPEDDPQKKYFIFGKQGVEAACKELDVKFLGEIPLEIPLREGSDSGIPYMTVLNNEGRPVFNSFINLASEVTQDLGLKIEKKGLFSRLFS
jgi:ATP-binding protein involved in chromosome partitioning